MYEVGLSKAFEAWHVMPDAPPPEGERHKHEYRLEVVLARSELDEREMVVDLDVLEAALERTVAEIADDDLDKILPSDGYAVTVEYLARWAFEKLSRQLPAGVEELSVRAWESAEAFGGYSGRLDNTSS